MPFHLRSSRRWLWTAISREVVWLRVVWYTFIVISEARTASMLRVESSEFTQFWVTMATDCRVLTVTWDGTNNKIIFIVGRERASSLLFQCIALNPWILIIFLCECVKRSIIYKGDSLRLYSWEMELNLDASFDNTWEWKGIREKAGEVNSTEVYITNDETSRWIVNGCYASVNIPTEGEPFTVICKYTFAGFTSQ
jgi:hypothetical protein